MTNSLRELLIVVFIVLIPTVPITILGWYLLGRRSGRGTAEIESGRSSATPFAMISVVGSAIALAAITALLLVVAVRALAA